ncbi:membrane-spanning 4-domains subfamily A member 4D-like isoform X1 [Prionailurus iriomotensis]
MQFGDRGGVSNRVVKNNGTKGHNYGSSTKRSSHLPGPVGANASPSGGTEQSAEFPKRGASYSWGEPDHDWPNEYLPVDHGKGLSFIPQTTSIPREHGVYLHFPFGTNLFNFIWNYIYCVWKENNKKNAICSSLGTNTLAAILAGVSLIILAIRTEVSSHYLSETVLARYFLIGIMIMKLILIILGLIVSVLLSAFGCSAVCCDVTSVVVDLSSNDCGVAVASLYHYYDDVAFQHA